MNRMAPAAMKRAAAVSMKPTAVAFAQKRFNSTSGTEVWFTLDDNFKKSNFD